MNSRYIDLEQVLEGYNRTGMPLVAVESGKLAAAAPADDIGIFYFIPEIVRHLNVSLDQAITIFFVGIIAFSFLVGLIGCMLWLKKPVMKAFGIIGLGLVLFITVIDAGIYAVSACTVVFAVPLFMYFIEREKFGTVFYSFLAFTGLAMGFAHIIRAHSGTSVVILIFVVIWLSRTIPLRVKAMSSAAMIVCMILPAIFFNTLIAERDAYLSDAIPGYVHAPTTHTFWHQAYISMGYIDNEYGIEYSDWSAHSRALEIDPGMEYRSEHYSQILKGEVLRIAKENPGFIASLLLAKILKMLLMLVICANIGLVAMVLRPKPLNIELGFWLAIGFGSLFGILTIPYSAYILSFIAMCMMYAVAGVDFALDKGAELGFMEQGKK